ncbi:MAG TPA: chromosomal replication initiator protein DnaA [Ktedonobacteraceae bacterium]
MNANAKQIWQTALERLRLRVDVATFTTWFQATTALSLQEQVLVVSVGTTFSRQHLESRYSEIVCSILAEITGSPLEVRFVVEHGPVEQEEDLATLAPPLLPLPTQKRAYRSSRGRLAALRRDDSAAEGGALFASSSAPPSFSRLVAHRSPGGALPDAARGEDAPTTDMQGFQPGLFFGGEGILNARYTFNSFITGKSNRLAHAASLAVAEQPGHVYNPLFLYGGVGLGKTHLMHAVGQIGVAAGLNVLYVTSEKFTNEIINAIRFQKTEEFRAKYRQIDILLVDDIQFIAGKESTEEEFFHTFNSLHSANKQIIVTSDRPPKAIPSLQDRLRSRFEWGLLADIQAPEYEHRLAILRSKAESLRFAVPAAVIEYVARPQCNSVRELEGALNRVIAYATLHDAALSADLAARALENIYGGMPARPPGSRPMLTTGVVLEGVCSYYHVEVERLRSKQRDREIVWPRQIAMYLMREETDASLLQIGAELGGRDHTTIIHGCEKVRSEMAHDERVRREISALLNALRPAH